MNQKNKTIPNATCQTSNPGSGNTTSTSDMNYVIPVVNDTSLPIAQRKGVRSCTHHPISDFVSYQHISSSYHFFVSKLSFVSVPRNLQEALSDPKWRAAMQKLFTKTRLGIWLNYLMKRRSLAASWWSLSSIRPMVLWNDTKSDLLQKEGFTQTYGIDYEETFASIAKMNSIRVLLSIAANLDWPLHQFDVKKCISSMKT
jgi:hypothetical protein